MPSTISEYIKVAAARLAAAKIDTPSLDARLLVGHALGLSRDQILSQSHQIISENEIKSIDALITRRAAHESVARIVGQREFWSLNFSLNEATLEPRPDSETLVETVLKNTDSTASYRILDLGTGSGCLLLALLHELKNATGVGIDIAPHAIEQARINAEQLGLSDRARFQLGNWIDNINEKFDIVISNPPYIPADEIPGLMKEVRDFDPLRALDGGKDGMEVYRHLIPLIPKILNDKGFAIFEAGQGQADDVAVLLQKAGFHDVTKYKDLNGIERCVLGVRPL